MGLLMGFQLVEFGESPSAAVAFVRPAIGVSMGVISQVPWGCKSSATDGTFVRSFLRIRKCHLTIIARSVSATAFRLWTSRSLRSYIGMGHPMVIQVRARSESFSALFAFMRLFS
ncbi:hypothetical protein RvY_09570 [Ramazzottius varieornatus]|uniref:Uncharacterized protein n=1 Tax=Ramazzottius varieornatus TaxID=947166 RepID=A0A1D1VIW1_RAMVA|nr:hypothetical protein RvY_09570 [Ramazzottius varieornatus]